MISRGGGVLAGGVVLVALTLSTQGAGQRDARIVSDRVIVVFRSATVPADADSRVARAGGVVIARLDQVGVVLAAPRSGADAELVDRLRADAAVLAADYDVRIDLASPVRALADDADDPSAQAHLVHPLPTFSPALPADFFYTSSPQQWSVKRVGAQGGGIAGGGAGAWDTTMGAGTRIAILDTGVNTAHPDIAPNLALSVALTADDPALFGTPNCEVPDPANAPFDLPDDQHGHGSWTSSLAAAAAGAGTGLLIGVAPQAQILNIKVLRGRPATPEELKQFGVPDTPFNRCLFRTASALVSWVLQGMLLANAQGADVISMSLGAGVFRALPGGGGAAVWAAFNRITTFVTRNGSLLVAAAGNDAADLDRARSIVAVPMESPGVISVVATTNPAVLPPTPPERQPCAPGADCLAFYSNYGSSLHGVAAPGGDLPGGTCAPGGSPCLPTGFVRGACAAGLAGTVPPASAGYPETGPPPAGTSWGCLSNPPAAQHSWYLQTVGTSGAAPIVAGVAALVKSSNPRLSPAQIRTLLQQTADDIGKPGYDSLFNFGLVNATAAVGAAVK